MRFTKQPQPIAILWRVAELDLKEATVVIGAGLHLLQRDLLLEVVRVELEQTSREVAALL